VIVHYIRVAIHMLLSCLQPGRIIPTDIAEAATFEALRAEIAAAEEARADKGKGRKPNARAK
jgi:hypothetical protein